MPLEMIIYDLDYIKKINSHIIAQTQLSPHSTEYHAIWEKIDKMVYRPNSFFLFRSEKEFLHFCKQFDTIAFDPRASVENRKYPLIISLEGKGLNQYIVHYREEDILERLIFFQEAIEKIKPDYTRLLTSKNERVRRAARKAIKETKL